MIKKSSSRNQRSKAVKIKHGLQILLLVSICFWLIYQVKYSHDKKRELNEKDAKTSVKDESGGAVKFGRKDLHPHRDETIINHVEDEEESREENDESKRDEEHDEETGKHEDEQGEEANKHERDDREDANESVTEQEAAGRHEEEEEHEEEENRIDDLEVEREAGEDETDEPDEEKAQGELDREEEFIDEEKEREDDNDEKETEGDDGEDKEGQAEDEEHDESESSHSRHEAREEHYKGDDASSAVTHDAQTTLIETEKLGSNDADDNSGSSKTGQESNSTISSQINDGQDNSRPNLEENQVAEKAANSSEVVSEIKDHDDAKASPANSSLLKPAVTTEAKDQEDAGVNSSEVNMGSSNNLTMTGPSINGTENILDSPQAQNGTGVGVHTSDGSDQQNIRVEMAKASAGNSSSGESDSTSSISTIGAATSSNFTGNQTSAVSGENISSDTKAEAENVLKLPSMTKENEEHAHNETLDRRSEAGSSNTS